MDASSFYFNSLARNSSGQFYPGTFLRLLEEARRIPGELPCIQTPSRTRMIRLWTFSVVPTKTGIMPVLFVSVESVVFQPLLEPSGPRFGAGYKSCLFLNRARRSVLSIGTCTVQPGLLCMRKALVASPSGLMDILTA